MVASRSAGKKLNIIYAGDVNQGLGLPFRDKSHFIPKSLRKVLL